MNDNTSAKTSGVMTAENIERKLANKLNKSTINAPIKHIAMQVRAIAKTFF